MTHSALTTLVVSLLLGEIEGVFRCDRLITLLRLFQWASE